MHAGPPHAVSALFASGPICGIEHMSSVALEKHYRVRELASLWGFSDNTIIRQFSIQTGVLRLEPGTGRRKYSTLSIPELRALQDHVTLNQDPLQAQRSSRIP